MRNLNFRVCAFFVGVLTASSASFATPARLDTVTCADLRLEQQKGIEAGLEADLSRGPEWAKSNLNQERMQQIQLYISVDEQVKFGCRDAKITEEARAAAEAARRLELNPDADPLAPLKPAGAPANKPSGTSPSTDENDGDDADPDGAPKKATSPVTKDKKKTEAVDALKPKPKANDAYSPQPGTESVLTPPAGANSLAR